MSRSSSMQSNPIGLSTGALFPSYHTEDALEIAADYGFRVVEIYLQTPGEYDPAFTAELKSRLTRLGLRVHSVHNDTRHYHLWSAYRRRADESRALFERLIEIAAELNARAITWHGFHERLDDPSQFERFAAITRVLGEQARQAGVTLTVENVSWCYLRGVDQIRHVRAVGLPLGFTFDPFQAVEAGQNSLAILRAMGEQLTTVHLSDYGEGAIRHLPPGQGSINWMPIFRALREGGYRGPLILESPFRGDLNVLAAGRDFVARALDNLNGGAD